MRGTESYERQIIKIYRVRDTERKTLYVCVLGEFLGGGWRAVKGHIVDVKAGQHQRADSGGEGSLSNTLFLILILSLSLSLSLSFSLSLSLSVSLMFYMFLPL